MSLAKESKGNTRGNGYIGVPAYPNAGCEETEFRDLSLHVSVTLRTRQLLNLAHALYREHVAVVKLAIPLNPNSFTFDVLARLYLSQDRI